MGNHLESRQLLWKWLSRRLSDSALSHLQQQEQLMHRSQSHHQISRDFAVGFSRIAQWMNERGNGKQKAGKQNLELTPAEIAQATICRPGWQPQHWTLEQLARLWWVLGLPWQEQGERSRHLLNQLFNHGDVAELVALYQGLCLYPQSETFHHQATQGIRSNMTAVFDAVALRNPYPALYFDDTAWNQLVLKALFVESPLSEIHGFDNRLNLKLAQMLTDYAHERWAAGRTVHPELWRGLGAYATPENRSDLQRVLSSSDPLEQEAGALACANAPAAVGQELLSTVPRLEQKIQTQQLNWDDLYRRLRSARCR